MKAIVKMKPGIGAEYVDLPMPKIEDDELLVKVLATGICGSDRDIYEWKPAKQGIPLPMTMGHELFGEVVEVGSAVRGFAAGDRISSDSHMPCGNCYLCRTGKQHLCMKRGVLGHQKNGCFAEYLALPAVAAVKMAGDTRPELGALMEPMGVVYHAASAVPLSGKKVLVMGMGALGYMMTDAAKNLGASRVIICSTSDDKIARALNESADFGVNSKTENVPEKVLEYTDGAGADVVFEMTGINTLYNMAIDAMAYGGTMVGVGTPSEDIVIPKYFERINKKELTITATFGREMYQTWELMFDLLGTGRLQPEKYVGDILPMAEFKTGFESAKGCLGRVMLIP
jgi:threonine 3-dehydrogenase